MTISNASAQWSLSAKATATVSQGSGSTTLGDNAIQRHTWSAADIAYTVKIKAAAAGNVATLTLTTGAVTQDTGTPDVIRWTGNIADLAGEDFQGLALPTLQVLYGLRLRCPTGNGGTVQVNASVANCPDVTLSADSVLQLSDGGGFTAPGTLQMTFSTDDDEIEITVIGKA